MKIKEVIERVKSLYSKGVSSDDARLSNRHIYNKLITTRARVLSNDIKKKQYISNWNYQIIPCIELEEAPMNQCPCIPPIGCTVLRSVHPLPKFLTDLNGELIQRVSDINSTFKIEFASINAINSLKGNKYSKKSINYFIHGGHLYIVGNTNLKLVSLVGVFENPLEVIQFEAFCKECTKCGECISYLNEDFPLDLDKIDSVIQLTIEEILPSFSSAVEDLTNDSKDSRKEQSK